MKSKNLIIFMLFCTVVCVTEYLIFHKFLPIEENSRNILLSNYFIDKPKISDEIQVITASDFCQQWTGLSLAEVDCQSGRFLKNQETINSETANQLLASTVEQINKYIEKTEEVKKIMLSKLEGNQKSIPIIQALDLLILKQKNAIAALSKSEIEQSYKITNENYKIIFRALLEIRGQNYLATKGDFKEKKWHISQIFFNKNNIVEQGGNLKNALTYTPWIFMVFTILILFFSYWRLKWIGAIAACIYIGFNILGILITADAAIYFGENSIYFPLNPFSNQLYRQLLVVSAGFVALLLILIFKKWMEAGLRIILNNPIKATWIIFFIITMAYSLQSPALGAEFLKIGVALLAAIHISDQGRVLHLISKYAPDTWSYKNIKYILKFKNIDPNNPIHRVIKHISRPLINLTMFGVLTIAMVTLLFNDLGGALISTLMLVTALFLGFGSRPTFIVLFLLGFAAVLVSFTNKVQSRIDLMLTPMHAAVSDFARLVAYVSASNPNGFGFGKLNWCNQENTCLPLQILSDYLPVVLNGIAGPFFNFYIFIFLSTYFIVLAGISSWRYIACQGIYRVSNLVVFFLLIGSLVQTILTFLGNWRLIPLTGVGVPTMSIGISSNLAISLAIGFFIISYPKSLLQINK